MCRKIADYSLIANPELFVLTQRVLEAIKNDWEPLGGIIPIPETSSQQSSFIQTLVKYESAEIVED